MLYVFDVDGTLSLDGKKISPHIKDSILKLEQEGNSVSFASARPIRDLIPIIPEFSSDNLLIGGNGSIVKKIDNEIEVVKSIDSDSFTSIKGIISDYSFNYIVDDS
ncbi:HAD family hydrolase [Lactobacillus terrae]|uniref:HAD family hydrolase n=1 Tax=Lactobacillus terrae TaxID=2269374 RepID=UPI000C1B75DD|nr:HAD hydrolase family protein [Lactobacillus terrae]